MIQRKSGEFDGAVDIAWSPPVQGAALLVLVAFDTAPTSAEDIEIIYDSGDGENFDVIVEKVDPSFLSSTDVKFLVGNPLALLRGDAVRVKYANTDMKRVNVTIIATDDYRVGGG